MVVRVVQPDGVDELGLAPLPAVLRVEELAVAVVVLRGAPEALPVLRGLHRGRNRWLQDPAPTHAPPVEMHSFIGCLRSTFLTKFAL